MVMLMRESVARYSATLGGSIPPLGAKAMLGKALTGSWDDGRERPAKPRISGNGHSGKPRKA